MFLYKSRALKGLELGTLKIELSISEQRLMEVSSYIGKF
jgi:hypothetical protein